MQYSPNNDIMKFHVMLKIFKSKREKIVAFSFLGIILLLVTSYSLERELLNNYKSLQSITIRDRNSVSIAVKPNQKDYYAHFTDVAPSRFKELLLKKEDRFFYYHPGVNPLSIIRASLQSIGKGKFGGSSTITQQLVKILLNNEQERGLKNKIVELAYAISLEIFLTKEDVLTMYINSVYLGNQVQGFAEASNLYFGKSLSALGDVETTQLLATLGSPSTLHPWKVANKKASEALLEKHGVEAEALPKPSKRKYSHYSPTFFELQSLGIDCTLSCDVTLDEVLTEKVRGIVQRNIIRSYDRGVRNGAVVIIKLPENELLAIVGSPDPERFREGSQINMAIEPRPIGSTAKPFIYLEGFKKGLRPYTTVEDREYKYTIATGFPLYPKNYDGKYRGTVTLHEALSNSLNVPTVKVLEYIGLTDFYSFLENTLGFRPIRDLDSYQYGIALGGLEMDLLTLTHLFTLFPNEGRLSPLTVLVEDNTETFSLSIPPQADIYENRQIADPKYVQLINKILNDRTTGVEQFGLKSNLNLIQSNYAVKTGTSRDFHDSWVVGYTPDFVVGVWLGNSKNTPLQQITGQSGAGAIWREVMELLFTSSYNNKTLFSFDKISGIRVGNNVEHSLPEDVYEEHLGLLVETDLLISPHDNDTFSFVKNMTIPLRASEDVVWFINGTYHDEGRSAIFAPSATGVYEIEALDDTNGRKEFIRIIILKE